MNATRDLVFGLVIPGVNRRVAPDDPVRSGVFDVLATLGARLRIRFNLPTRLNGPGGARMPVRFGNGDAIALETGPGATPQVFNPRRRRTIRLRTGNRLLLYLGGQVRPSRNQRSGLYRNTVLLTVTVL